MITIPRFVHRASAALPAAGAYTTTAMLSVPEYARTYTFAITYTRGAEGGYPQFKVTYGNGTESGFGQSVDELATKTGSIGLSNAYDSVIDVLALHPTDGNAVTRMLTIEVPEGVTQIALQAAEVGVTATPGTLAIAAVGGGR